LSAQPSQPPSSRASTQAIAHTFHRITLPDGRRLDYISIGDPTGRPFLWLMSGMGLARWHRAAERTLGEKGLHMIVPVRAGYGHSSQPPLGRHILDIAVDDTCQLMNELDIACCPVIAPCDTMLIALTMAKKHPARLSHIFGGGAMFPIATPSQYGRLHMIARFFRANARYAPRSLPYIFKVFRTAIRQQGVPAHIRKSLSRSPIDRQIFEDPDVFEPIVAGYQLLVGPDTHCERAFSAEVLNLHRAWPTQIGAVNCPVTLFHGVHDGNSAIETAREYASLYPHWELIEYPEEGQLVLYGQWEQMMARLEKVVIE
jgi:pimeloyl-ACP methyl ester carboxylesterase